MFTDSDDADMFDQSDEDKDSAHQVSKSSSGPSSSADDESKRSQREGTPAPQSAPLVDSPSSTRTEKSADSPLAAAPASAEFSKGS